jgi:hypothetical protein
LPISTSADVVAKPRLDAELVRRGLARSRQHAQDLIDEGRVRVSGLVATKPATGVDPATPLQVVESATDDYASRGGHKLAGALDALGGPAVVGRRPAVSPTFCCAAVRAKSSRSTSATGSWRGRCGPTSECACTNVRMSGR